MINDKVRINTGLQRVEDGRFLGTWGHNSPVCPWVTAEYTYRPLVSLAVEIQLFSMMLTLSIDFNSLCLRRTGVKTVQIIQLGNEVLHQVVLSVTLLVEHLRQHKVGLLFICNTAEFDTTHTLIYSAVQRLPNSWEMRRLLSLQDDFLFVWSTSLVRAKQNPWPPTSMSIINCATG